MTTFFYSTYGSPVGELILAGTAAQLHSLRFPKHSKTKGPAPHWQHDDAPFRDIKNQLKAYFGGELTRFDVPIKWSGTPFQNRVWQALLHIPYGQTRTYGQIAADLNAPNAARAVGAANGQNPLAIVVPCHRVIGANGALTGFAGGLPTKQTLLQHEGAL